MCMPKAPKVPAAPPAPPKKSDEEIQNEKNEEQRRRLGAKGRSSTILTSSQGAVGESSKKTLLGQ